MQVADRTNAFRRGQYLRALPASEEPPALLVGSYCFTCPPPLALGPPVKTVIADKQKPSVVSELQTVNLVLDTIRQAVHREKKKVAAELHLHSDQGFQYTSQAYFKLTKQYGITPSMSRRGNPYDNAMAENFFSILKTECIYRHKPATFSEADEMIDRYILFYNHERIQSKTGVPPLSLRHSC